MQRLNWMLGGHFRTESLGSLILSRKGAADPRQRIHIRATLYINHSGVKPDLGTIREMAYNDRTLPQTY